MDKHAGLEEVVAATTKVLMAFNKEQIEHPEREFFIAK